ncbi:MAG: HupE/UreJ family protein [Nitrospirota bacterium]
MTFRKLFLFFITGLLCLITVPVHAHNLPMGGSRWCFGKNTIIGNIDLGPSLLAEIKGIKEGHFDLDSLTDEQLQHIATDILQPYIDKRLSIAVAGKIYPAKVNKIVRSGNLYTIWLSVNDISFTSPVNPVRIDYTLLFEETNNAHVNLAYGYLSEATGAELQKVFDFSPPAMQTTFDHNAPVWEMSVKGVAQEPAAAPKADNHAVNVGSSSIKDIAGQNRAAIAAKSGIANALNSGSKKISRRIAGALPAERIVERNLSVLSKSLSAATSPDTVANMPAKRSQWANIGEFIVLGIEHILTGYDHIAFLLALIVIGLSIREVLKIITAFTVAHSITLLLAATQVVSLNSRIVESVIAFSICFVALENLYKKKVNYRWLVTFGFGLVHGFGFASVLQDLIVGKSNLLVSVVSFNLGVEIGQLMIFLVLLPVLYLLKNKLEFRKVTIGVSLAIFLLGFTWLIERGFNLKLLPI